jgi:hypothetical protein
MQEPPMARSFIDSIKETIRYLTHSPYRPSSAECQFGFDVNQAAQETSNEIITTVYLKDGLTEQVKLTELDNYLQLNQEKIEPRKFRARRPPIKKNAC